jgi:hypothetical protein
VRQAIEALKRAIACSGVETGKNKDDELGARCKRVELFFQLANAYEEVQERTEAMKYLEICVEESDEVEGSGDMDAPLPTTTVSVINRSRLLLARWSVEGGDDTRARYLAGQVDQGSEFAEEARDLLRSFATTEDADDRE